MQYTFKSLAFRFLRGFIAGAVATMATMTPSIIASWRDLGIWLAALSLAGIVGGITGGILAIDKYVRSVNSDQ